ncbi:hypothetical protein NE237_010762 [Protea cynaroides]|uniref:Uncharacterized protein n=1 Tax=Protea cynaroides TaxID=273540 RepID=A0A9Q0L0B4_9MAGN|nr:hypothetical protein NE237_010762 [Protea cynaroides]
MDEHIGKSNKIIIGSFHDNKYEVIHAKVADLNKKRKLENEQLFFPLSKHKSGYRSSSSEHEQPLAEKLDENQVMDVAHTSKGKVVEIANERLELESSKDSNSFVGGSDSAKSENAENENILEAEYPADTFTHAPSFTSSGSCSSNCLKDTLRSYHRRIIEEHTVDKEDQVLVAGIESNRPDDEGQLQSREGAQDLLQNFELHADHLGVAYQVDVHEQCLDEDLEDIMLYSNGPSEKDQFVLSSGRWSLDKEATQRHRPPTIDQEFAEYFSALML